MVSRVVTVAQALFAGPDSDPAVARPRAGSRLPEFILGPENAVARVVIDGLIETLQL